MTDIVERLRDPSRGSPRWSDTMDEAADEIERVRGAGAQLQQAREAFVNLRPLLEIAAKALAVVAGDHGAERHCRPLIEAMETALKETGHD